MGLKARRREHGIRQADLAKKVGVSQSLISHVERGRRRLSRRQVQRVAKILDCSATELLKPRK